MSENHRSRQISGALRARVEECIEDIAEDLIRFPVAASWGGSLGWGAAGCAMFFAYLHLHTGTKRYRAAADRLLDEALQWVARSNIGPQLYRGFLGVGWVAQHLRESMPDDELYKWLLRYSRAPVPPFQFDLMNGFSGIGVYALERHWKGTASGELGASVVDQLLALAHTGPEGVAWKTTPDLLQLDAQKYPAGAFNVGVAHGTPGVAAILAQFAAAGWANEMVRTAVEESVRWISARRILVDGGVHLPSYYAPGVSPERARMAWCYGMPGVVAALTLVQHANATEAVENLVKSLMSGLEVTPANEQLPRDSSVCHGFMGLAHIYRRLGEADRYKALNGISTLWLERALESRVPAGLGGFCSWQPHFDAGKVHWRYEPEPGFLTGAAGVGLTMLAQVSPVEPEWDRVLLLSLIQ